MPGRIIGPSYNPTQKIRTLVIACNSPTRWNAGHGSDASTVHYDARHRIETLDAVDILYVLNIAYGDIGTLYYSVFINPTPLVHYTQVFLLGAAVLVEIPMVMILLSRMLKYRPNRLANIIAGVALTCVELVSLFVGTPTLAYSFIAVIAIATTIISFSTRGSGQPFRQRMPQQSLDSFLAVP